MNCGHLTTLILFASDFFRGYLFLFFGMTGFFSQLILLFDLLFLITGSLTIFINSLTVLFDGLHVVLILAILLLKCCQLLWEELVWRLCMLPVL